MIVNRLKNKFTSLEFLNVFTMICNTEISWKLLLQNFPLCIRNTKFYILLFYQ